MDWISCILGICVGAFVTGAVARFLAKKSTITPTTLATYDSGILDLVYVPLIAVDSRGTIIRCNYQVQVLFGYNPEELIGRNLRILFSQHQWKSAEKWFTLAIEGKKHQKVRRKNGKEFSAEIYARNFPYGSGQAQLLSFVDRTELDESESKRELYESLASKMIEESNSVVHQISHDLKSPFRQIAQYSEMLSRELRKREVTEQEDRYLDVVLVLAKKGTELIDYILKINQLGKDNLSLAEVDLSTVCNDVITSWHEQFPEYSLDYSVDQNLSTVKADKVLAQELITNLVSNCFKYSKDKNVNIHMGEATSGVPFQEPDVIWSAVAQRNEPVFFLRDQGIGIPKENYQEVFQIFRRLHAKDRYEGGHGVGLTIVKKIIQTHKGKIWIESKEGEGTTFFFTFGIQQPAQIQASDGAKELAQGGV